jgi:hypothetical protein
MSGPEYRITRRLDNQQVVASLRDAIKPDALLAIEQAWAPHRVALKQALLAAGVPKDKWPESLHWNWSKKIPELRLLESGGFAIDYEGRCQGVMLTKTASYLSLIEKGKPLVYIDYLEAAPWNWKIPSLSKKGDFGGIGSVLFAIAVRQSIDESFYGRIGLHSLPQAEAFYAQVCGMQDFGPDPKKQNLRYFELSQKQAEQHWKDGGGK